MNTALLLIDFQNDYLPGRKMEMVERGPTVIFNRQVERDDTLTRYILLSKRFVW